MLLLVFADSPPTNSITITAANATVAITATVTTPRAHRPRRELVWTYGIDAVQTGAVG